MTRASMPSPSDNGVYALHGDAAALKARVAAAGGIWHELKAQRGLDRATFMDLVARALKFPHDFGGNWDALADSVHDLSWLPFETLVLELCGVPEWARRAPDEWHIALDILRDAATYWGTRGRRFLVLVHGADELPAFRP